VPAYPKTALGELRNLAVRSAGGEFICQWDDDDWYHSRRLEQQYEGLFSDGRHGSVIVQWIVFDAITSTAYLSHVRLWEGSILCRKNILQLKAYADKTVGEDTKTIEYLAQMDHLHFLTGLPGLYIYVYHGSNTWNYDHWSAIFRFSTELSKEESSVVEDILNGKYSVHEGSLLLDGILEQSFSAPIVVP
jgi:glycosyltransferase involved in cell wall biosynthesis